MPIKVDAPALATLKENAINLFNWKNLFRFKHKSYYSSTVLTLNCVATVLILSIAASCVTYTQYFGDPIECIPRSFRDFPPRAVERYCWMDGSFSLYGEQRLNKQQEIVGNYPGIKSFQENDKVVFHKYYPWIYFVLFIQAIIFIIPREIWKASENKYFRKFKDLSSNLSVAGDKRNNDLNVEIAFQVAGIMLFGKQLFRSLLFAEFLCIVNLCAQIFVTNVVLNGSFLDLGLQWYIHWTIHRSTTRYDPLSLLFPRLAKCTKSFYGPSGTLENIDALCYLNLNIINEKVFIILWFWYSLLLLVSVLFLLYRLVEVLPCIRRHLITVFPENEHFVDRLCWNDLGYYFVLKIFSANLTALQFAVVLEHLSKILNYNGKICHRHLITRTNNVSMPQNKVSSENHSVDTESEQQKSTLATYWDTE